MTTAKKAFESQTEKPTPISCNPDGIPAAMKVRPQWVAWSYTWKAKDSKWDKPLLNPRTGFNASHSDPATWGTYDEAFACWQERGLDGLGYVFSKADPEDAFKPDDPFVGIDLDNSIDSSTRKLKPWAQEIVDRLNSYTETSPSGTGVKVFVVAKKTLMGCSKSYEDGKVEVYEKDKYYTMTGQHWPGTPTTLEKRDEELTAVCSKVWSTEKAQANGKPRRLPADEVLIAKAKTASNGADFSRLWSGDTNGNDGDESAADLALCNHLAFWCGPPGDASRIDSLFRQSGLMRHKWDQKHYGDGRTYGQGTIEKALEGRTEFYEPGGTVHFGDSFTIGSLSFRIGTARRTPAGKLIVQVSIVREGKVVDMATLTTAASGRKEAARIIAGHLGDKADLQKIDQVLGKLLAAGADQVAKIVPKSGRTIRDIITGMVLDELKLTHRTDSGVWSEARGAEVRRQDFITNTTNQVIEAAAEAIDSPCDQQGNIQRPSLVKSVRTELEVLWADQMRALPMTADATLGRETAAGRKFWSAMVRLWTMPKTWEVATNTGEAQRSSLICRARQQQLRYSAAEGKSGRRPIKTSPWHRVLNACDAWWREVISGDEWVTLLAMTWRLPHQIGVDLPGVTDQKSLNALGEQYGAIDPHPLVPVVTARGRVRLAVLSCALFEELWTDPDDYGPDEAEKPAGDDASVNGLQGDDEKRNPG